MTEGESFFELARRTEVVALASRRRVKLTEDRVKSLGRTVLEPSPRGPLPFRRDGLHVGVDGADPSIHWVTLTPGKPEHPEALLVGLRALQDYLLLVDFKDPKIPKTARIPEPERLRAAPHESQLEHAELLGFTKIGPHKQLGSEYCTVEADYAAVDKRMWGDEGAQLERTFINMAADLGKGATGAAVGS